MKMTKMVCAAGLLACAGTLLSCMSTGTSNTKVERIEASQVQDLSGYWNDKDVQIVCEGLINECVASPRISQFSAKHNRAPIVKLGKITKKLPKTHYRNGNFYNKPRIFLGFSGMWINTRRK